MKKIFSMMLIIAIMSVSQMQVFAQRWITDKEPVTDYAYSFAVVGDTQTITRKYPEKLTCIYDWIADSAEEKNIQFVFGLGDITDTNTDDEYALAKPLIEKLNNVVPYSIVRGNHDWKPEFNKWFPYSEYTHIIDGSYDGTMLNTYKKFQVGSIKYLVINLDYGPKDEVLEWAGDLIELSPDNNVIITTHAYLYSDGTPIEPTDPDSCPPTLNGGYNDGIDIWNKLVKKYSNIVLVLSGHIASTADDDIVMSTAIGDAGNKVTQILVNPQTVDYGDPSPAGMVAMLYFSEDGSDVQVEYYSTVNDAFFKECNQFSFEMEVVGTGNANENISVVSVDEIQLSLDGEEIKGDIFVALYDKNNKLVSTQTYEAKADMPLVLNADENTKYIKLFWWDTENSLNPLCEYKTIEL